MTDSFRYRRSLALLPGLIAAIAYSLTVCRSIWIGDGGEFALALKTLGICHPPGYPLFTITGALFVQVLGFLRPVLAANLFSVAASAACVSVLYLFFRRELNAIYAFTLSIAWAFMPLFWEQTSGVEIYNLNILAVLLTLLALESTAAWKWPLTFYLLGLSLAGHPESLALLPAILYCFWRERGYRNIRIVAISGAFVLLAGTIYLYLWVRAAQFPISDWGHPVGIDALWQHMTLKQYSGRVYESLGSQFLTLKLYARSIVDSWWWLGVAATLSGTYFGFRSNSHRTVVAILILISSLILSAFHQATDYAPFYLVPMLATLLLIANNFVWLQQFRIKTAILLPAAALIAIAMLVTHYRENDKSSYHLYEDYSRLILDTAERGVIFTAADINSFGALYLRYGEGYQPETEVYDRSIRLRALQERARQLSGTYYENYFDARSAVFRYDPLPKFVVRNPYFNEPDWLPGADSLYAFGVLYSVLKPPPRTAAVPSYPADYEPGDLMSNELLANLDLSNGEDSLQAVPPDTAGALAEFHLAIGRMRDEPRGNLLNLIGAALRRYGFGDLALETYRDALSRPILSEAQRRDIIFNMSNVYKDRGNADLRRGDYAGAAEQFVEALKYDSANPTLILNIGLIYAQTLHDPTKARIYLERYLKLVPNDSRVQNLIKTFQ